MFSGRAKQIYTALLFVASTSILFLLIFLLSFDRASFVNFLLTQLQRNYLRDILNEKIISPQKFLLIRYLCCALIAITLVLTAILYYFREKVIRSFFLMLSSLNQGLQSLLTVFKNSTKKQNTFFVLLLLAVFIRGLYYLISVDLGYDETWCYNYYTSKPFYLTIFSYSGYPLYESITHLFKWLPFPEKINIRLPSLIAGMGCSILLYAWIKKITSNGFTALAALLFFVSSPFINRFIFCAKGEMIELFFAILSSLSIFYYFRTDEKTYLKWFAFGSIAGLYSMPTHVYLWLIQITIAFIYIFSNKKQALKPFLFANALVLALSFLFYMPMALGSGVSFATELAWGNMQRDYSVNSFIFLNNNSNSFFTGSRYGLGILLILVLTAALITRKFKKEIILLWAFVVLLYALPLLIYIFQYINIPIRSLAFMVLIIPLSIILLSDILYRYYKPYPLLLSIASIAVLIAAILQLRSFEVDGNKSNKKAIMISKLLMKNNVTHCYDNAPYSGFWFNYPALEYHYAQAHRNLDLQVAAKNSLRHQIFSLEENYDCIIDSIGADHTGYADRYINIYSSPEEGYEIFLRKDK
ncbi:MAG: glycosyltransferase family 39 protein [Bacteroidetes bacterium]|nr:glycosyltransferase family 39 protein [Bacteroidota bacterium]